MIFGINRVEPGWYDIKQSAFSSSQGEQKKKKNTKENSLPFKSANLSTTLGYAKTHLMS